MSEVHTSDISSDSMIKEDVPPREKRRNAREELAQIEPLEEAGIIYNAEVHGVAQCLLKVHRVAKYVKFCRCCSLPQETPSVVVPFIWFDAQLDFGIGIYLYFYYIKFFFIMSIICIGLSRISTIVFTKSLEDFVIKKVDNYSYSENRQNLTLNDDEYKFDDLVEDCSNKLVIIIQK